MLIYVGLLMLMRAPGKEIDGEDAVARAQKLLGRLGYGQSSELLSLGKDNTVYHQPGWWVGLKTKVGNGHVVVSATTGQPLRIQFPHERPQRNSDITPTKESVSLGWSILKTLGLDKDVVLENDSGFSSSAINWKFYRTVHGLRFFNINPNYAQMLSVEPISKTIEFFLISPALPPVNGWQPKVKGDQALQKIRQWAADRAKSKSRALPPVQGTLKAELGYWKFSKEKTARLVWRENSYVQIQGKPYAGGSYRIFVDALTGELIEPDDSLIGDNP